MKDCLIEVKRITSYDSLSAEYELPQDMPCSMKEGMTFLSRNAEMPEGFCEEAWKTLAPFVRTLASGGGDIYGKWMKDPHSAMISCNDGFRPVSFYIHIAP